MNSAEMIKYLMIISSAGLLSVLALSFSIQNEYAKKTDGYQLAQAKQIKGIFKAAKEGREKRVDASAKRVFLAPDNLQAKAFVIYNAQDKKIIASKGAEQPLPLASITKIFTAMLAIEHLDLNDTITIRKKDLRTEGESGLKEGTKWQIAELIKYMLFVSSNDAASALARKLQEKIGKNYKELFDNLAKKLRLQTAFAVNPSGLDENSSLAGAYASAKDVAKAFAYSTEKYTEVFEVTSKKSHVFKDLSGNEYRAKNTNQSIEYIFGAVASKTGFTDLAGGNLAIAFDLSPNDRLVIVVLGSSKEGRFSDTVKLYNATLDYYSLK